MSFEIKNGVLIKYTGNDAVLTIPDGVTEIGDSAFYGCTALMQINIPNSVTKMGYSIFYGCTSLAQINIPDGVTEISNRAFYGCTSLTQISIPDSVTEISNRAFYGCTSLTQINLPDSVTSLGEYAFYGCNGLADSNGFVIVGNILFNYYGNDTVVTIPDGVAKINKGAFECCSSIKSIVISSDVKVIEPYAFDNCENLSEITVLGGDAYFDTESFFGAKKIKRFNVPEGFKISTRIFGNAFPLGLVKQAEELYKCFSLELIKKYYLRPDVWKKLNIKLRAEILLNNQAKSWFGAYKKCIDVSQADELGEAIIKCFPTNASAAKCNKLAGCIELMSALGSSKTLIKMYELLKEQKNGEKALELLENDQVIGLVINAEDDKTVTVVSPKDAIMNALASERVTKKGLEDSLKQYYNLNIVELPKLLSKDGEELPEMVFAYLLIAHEKIIRKNGKYVVVPQYEISGVKPLVDDILNNVDSESLTKALRTLIKNSYCTSGTSKKKFLAYPLCRYIDEETMRGLASFVSPYAGKMDAPVVFKYFFKAAMYSTTKNALLFIDRHNGLEEYLKRRILNDDVGIAKVLDAFTLAGVTECLKMASENRSTNIIAILLEYKNSRYDSSDPLDEFVL